MFLFTQGRLIRRVMAGVGLGLFALAQGAMAQQDGNRTQMRDERVQVQVDTKLTVSAGAMPRIAVTDLSYEEKVAQNFVKYDRTSSGSASQQSSGSAGGFAGSAQAQVQKSEHFESGSEVQINRGELRKFTADLKGELIKTHLFKLVQGKPWLNKDTDALYDIIERIKEGYYPNADFVLFGSVSAVDYRNDVNPIQGTNAVNHVLAMEMVVDFSLINTKTYEVVAAFSARGEGSDARLVNSGNTTFNLSRSKAVSDLSHSLGQAAASELVSQFGGEASN